MSSNDIETGDPWDLAQPASDHTAETGAEPAEAAAPPPTPPPPPVDAVEAETPAASDDDAADGGEPATETSPAVADTGISVPDFDAATDWEPPSLDTDIQNLSAEIESLDTDTDGLELEVEGLDTDTDGLELEVEGLDTDIQNLDVEIEGLDTDTDGLELEVEGLDTDIQNLDVEIESLDTDIQSLSAEIEGLDVDFSDLAAESETDSDGAVDATDLPEVDLDEAEHTAPSGEAPGGSRGPMSALLAGTGLFGDEPAWAADDSPPAVYKELEDLTPGDNDAGDHDAGDRDAGDLDSPSPDTEDDAGDGVESPSAQAEGVDASGADTVEDLGGDEFEISFEAPTADDDSETTADDGVDPAVEAEDVDFDRVAALVAEVEPVVEGDDSTDTPDGIPVEDGSLDWLDEAVDDGPVDDPAETETAARSVVEVDDTDHEVGFSVPEVRFDTEDAPIDQDPDTVADQLPDATDEADEVAVDSDQSIDDDGAGDDLDAPGIAFAGLGDDTAPTTAEADFDESSADEGLAGESLAALLDEADAPAHTSPVSEHAAVAGASWGERWDESQQGWVDGEWRPIVTTAERLGAWTVDVYLGVVAGDATAPSIDDVAAARAEAERTMVSEAVRRGAHAVIAAQSQVAQVGDGLVVSVTGTAVTLAAAE